MQNDMRDRLTLSIENAKKLYESDVTDLSETEYVAECLLSEGFIYAVRCKDCKHCRKDTYFDYCDKYSRPFDKMYVEKDHYCSYGERKDENG